MKSTYEATIHLKHYSTIPLLLYYVRNMSNNTVTQTRQCDRQTNRQATDTQTGDDDGCTQISRYPSIYQIII